MLAQLMNIIGPAELAPRLERVRLTTQQVLHGPGVTTPYVYFAVDALVSVMQVMRSGQVTETALIGNDGMVGAEQMMGGSGSPMRAVVQSEGHAYRLRLELLIRCLEDSIAAQELVLAYVRSLMIQTAQTVACNRHHTIEQQLCRWLLLGIDRLPGNEIKTTHERIASALGVRRESVTLVATRLRDEGAIEYCRGHIRVCNRERLHKHVCECYGVVQYESLRPLLAPPRGAAMLGDGLVSSSHRHIDDESKRHKGSALRIGRIV